MKVFLKSVCKKVLIYAKSLRDDYITANAEKTIKNSYISCGVEKAYRLKNEKSAKVIIDLLK